MPQSINEILTAKIKNMIDSELAQSLSINNIKETTGGGYRSLGAKYLGPRFFVSDTSSHIVGSSGGGTTVSE